MRDIKKVFIILVICGIIACSVSGIIFAIPAIKDENKQSEIIAFYLIKDGIYTKMQTSGKLIQNETETRVLNGQKQEMYSIEIAWNCSVDLSSILKDTQILSIYGHGAYNIHSAFIGTTSIAFSMNLNAICLTNKVQSDTHVYFDMITTILDPLANYIPMGGMSEVTLIDGHTILGSGITQYFTEYINK